MNKIFKFSIIFSFLFLHIGCGMKSLVVPNLDWLITREGSKSLSLNSAQKKEFRKDVNLLLSQLKPLVKKTDLDYRNTQLESLNIKLLVKSFTTYYNEALKVAGPTYVNYLVALNSSQLIKFKEYNENKNSKILKKRENIVGKTIEKFESFLGSLSHAQENIIKNNKQLYLDLLGMRIKRRVEFQKELYSLLNEQDLVLRKELILNHIINYSVKFDKNDLYIKSYKISQSIMDIATKPQSNYFSKNLSKYSSWIKAYLKESY